ncbi:MAG: DNA topoisomerase I [Candidatus ainarchaeum sp.]|nr:DNA topoisomerase I [Candidatus ainarchaeum sp.]
MELIIAEKPRVAEKIASAIGDKVERKSYEGIYYYEAVRNGKQVLIAPAVGHVYTLVEKEKSRGYPVFDIEWVPAYRASKEAAYTKGYVELIQKLAKKADTFVSACDYDIEGSTIAYNVFRFATTIREGRRMKFSALTQSDLVDAYENRSEFDYNNAYAGEARHILDWYYGINLSRALMSALRAASRYRVLSIGRVQGPALGMLSELERDIRAFVPSPYWELTMGAKGVEFIHTAGRFLEEPLADAALARTAASGTVKSVDRKDQAVPAMPCFDLTSLQLEAYRLFKYSPSRVLELAQSLYEASLITYPRTSSQKIPPSINLPKIISDLSANPEYAPLTKKIASEKWFKPVQGKKEDPAHPAIHPTGQHGRLDAQEKNLYDLIVRRFLAAFAPPAARERVRIEIDAGGEPYAVSGSRLTEKGWTEFYGKYYTSEDVELPQFSVGEQAAVEDKKKAKKETKPPKRYTQASLVSELEGRHLGTKSTRAVIIDTLMKRGYASGTSSIEVSDFGLKVCEVLQKYAPEILDENLTRRLEDEMEGIQEGKTDKDAVIAEGREILTGILGKWKANEAKIGAGLAEALKATLEQENMVGVCDKCGKNLRIIRLGAGRQFIGCTGYPACRNAYPLPGGAFVKVTGKPCPSCGKPTVFVKRSGGRPFTMCIDPKCPSKADWGKKKAAAPAAGAAPAAAEAKPAKEPAVAAEAAPAKRKRKPAKKAAAPKPGEAAEE